MNESYDEMTQRELNETLADNAMAETRTEWFERSYGPPPSRKEIEADLEEMEAG